MNKKRVLFAGLIVFVVLVSTSAALATALKKDSLADVRAATAGYQSIEAAQRAGYEALLHCLSDPQAGGMGFHYVNGQLVGDTNLDPRRPEALVYERQNNGKLKLVAVEYIVFKDIWDPDGLNQAPPTLLGQTFELKNSLVPHGIPPFYELHVWLWKHNPSGIFADFNPNVSCPAE
jgi:hypothetical protein